MLNRLFLAVEQSHIGHMKNFATANAATTAAPTAAIRIPARIKRKPTDLLKALASTVKEDPTGPNFMYVDDPAFTPTRLSEAPNFAISKELGRKSAKYFATQYPTLFMYDEDEPRLMAFRPIQKPTSESADDEDALNDRIDRLWVRSAMAVYENAMARDQSISTGTVLKLLELLAFYNNDEQTDLPESPIEIWFRNSLQPPPISPWDENGLAVMIYDTLPEPKPARATAALICGMLKYFAVEKGYELWRLSREAGGEEGKLKDVRVYVALMKYGVERLQAVNSERWDMIKELLGAMAEDGVQPNVQVFNAALGVLTKAKRWKRTEESAKELWQEMISLGIQPSLGTYCLLLRVFQNRPSLRNMVNAILIQLENQPSLPALVDEADGKFFVDCMSSCCEQLQDRALTLRLHRLFKTGDNYLYMLSQADEVRYYEGLLFLMSVTEDTKSFYERFYKPITPRYFVPGLTVMFRFLRNIETSSAYQYLPNFCTDMLVYDHVFRRDVLKEFLNAALRAPTYTMSTDMREKMIKMAKEIYDKLELQYEFVEQQKKFDKIKGKQEPVATTNAQTEDTTENGEKNEAEKEKVDTMQRQGRSVRIRLEWTADVIASLALMCARGGAPRQAWDMYARVVPLSQEEMARKTTNRVPITGHIPEAIALEMLDHFIKEKWFEESYAALRIIATMGNEENVKLAAEKIKRTVPTNAVQMGMLEKYLKEPEEVEKKEGKKKRA